MFIDFNVLDKSGIQYIRNTRQGNCSDQSIDYFVWKPHSHLIQMHDVNFVRMHFGRTIDSISQPKFVYKKNFAKLNAAKFILEC